MADPAYIVDGVLSVTESWVAVAPTTTVPLTGATSLIVFESTDDGQVGDFSQYMDLVILWYGKSTRASGSATDSFQVELNDESSNNWRTQKFDGDGTNDTATGGVLEGRWQAGIVPTSDTSGGVAAETFGCCVIHLFDINSGKYKTGVSQYAADADGQGNVGITTSTWAKTEAIDKVEIMMGYNQAAGTTASMFGILPSMLTTGTLP